MNGKSNLPEAAEAKPQEDAGPKKSFAVIVSLRCVYFHVLFCYIFKIKSNL